jgi:hypothetical protein
MLLLPKQVLQLMSQVLALSARLLYLRYDLSDFFRLRLGRCYVYVGFRNRLGILLTSHCRFSGRDTSVLCNWHNVTRDVVAGRTRHLVYSNLASVGILIADIGHLLHALNR